MVNNELIIEVKLFVRQTGMPETYQQAQSLAEKARSLAEKFGCSSSLVVLYDDTDRSDTNHLLEKLLERAAFPFVVCWNLNTFTGNALAETLAPWLLD